jgi:hypothetical protein
LKNFRPICTMSFFRSIECDSGSFGTQAPSSLDFNEYYFPLRGELLPFPSDRGLRNKASDLTVSDHRPLYRVQASI